MDGKYRLLPHSQDIHSVCPLLYSVHVGTGLIRIWTLDTELEFTPEDFGPAFAQKSRRVQQNDLTSMECFSTNIQMSVSKFDEVNQKCYEVA